MSARPPHPATITVPIRSAVTAILLAACAAGCDRDPETRYGTLRGDSLNGVSAFAQMLRDSGRTTSTRRALGERMVGRHDVAIVFGTGSAAPPADARDLLDRFLDRPGGQTVVFVIRDSDAAIDYWLAVVATQGLTPDKATAAHRKLAEAQDELASRAGASFPAGTRTLGYGLSARKKPVTAPGEVRLADSTAAPLSARWPRARRLEPPAGARPLWTQDGEPLLVERRGAAVHAIADDVFEPAAEEEGATDDEAQAEHAAESDEEPHGAATAGASPAGCDRTLILASAAPLLNGGLVDRGNRRLARELIALLPEGCRVVVVGSEQVRDNDAESDRQPSMWRLLMVPPNPWIAAQALLAMILFCWWKAPIFGRPRRETAGRPEDFGHHVAALAALLRRSQDDDFAQRRLEAWHRPGERTEAKPPGGANGA
jgi:hypothetical protein